MRVVGLGLITRSRSNAGWPIVTRSCTNAGWSIITRSRSNARQQRPGGWALLLDILTVPGGPKAPYYLLLEGMSEGKDRSADILLCFDFSNGPSLQVRDQ